MRPKKCGLLGEKLSHSFSPYIHSYLGNYEYALYEKSPEELDDFIKNGDWFGLNVTIPYKKTVLKYCDEMTSVARRIGSVNTITKNQEGYIYGDNTDYAGFIYLLDKSGIDVHGKKVLILGSGGASLAVKTALTDKMAGEVVTVSRSGENNYDNISKNADANVIVNTTPVGMYPNCGVSPVDLSIFKNCSGVIDIIYNPAKTKLLLDAEDMGIPCAGGLAMLVAQASRAAEAFLIKRRDDSKIDEIADKIQKKTFNIALIGMPGCGKSSTGKVLSEMTAREFVDTDDLVEKAAGKSIPEIFAQDGENEFRRLETEALRAVSCRSGLVISTGGGIVTRLENRRLLRQNSVTVFLKRSTSELPTDGRPLSQSTTVSKIADERLPLYNDWSDYSVKCTGAEKTAELIIRELNL